MTVERTAPAARGCPMRGSAYGPGSEPAPSEPGALLGNQMASPTAFARISRLHAELADAYAELAAEAPAPQPDRVVGLREAAQRLSMTRAWLARRGNWQRVGGYLDADRRVKFTTAALAAYVKERA